MTNTKSPNSTNRYEPEDLTYHAEDEIDLIELIKPLWQQKILIAIITTLTITTAIVMVLMATPKYKIYTMVKPGIYRWDSNNNPIPYLKPSDLKNLLTGGIFDTYMTTNTEFENIAPKIEVKTDRKGDQLIAYFFWPNPTDGKKIMAGFIDFLNNPNRNTNQNKLSDLQIQRPSLDKSTIQPQKDVKVANIEQPRKELKPVDRQKNRLKREIERINSDSKMTGKEIRFTKDRIAVVEKSLTGYEKSRLEINENTTKIISLRDKLLQTPPDDSLKFLLLANTIQQNIAYLNTIEQKVEATRKEVISLHTAKAMLIKKQEQYHLKIADLQSKINTLSIIEAVEDPQASTKPEKPKKRKIVVLAGIMGLFLATIIAYIRHFIKTAKLKPE